LARVFYISKRPPAPSSVALYAAHFEQVLARVGEVHSRPAPPDPHESQQLRAALRGAWLGWTLVPKPGDIVHVELSGRALFEFFAAAGVAVRRRDGVTLALTCHDPPSVVGPALLFACLDRRGLRRAAMLLSRLLGQPLEGFVLRRADHVFALTDAGARALRTRFRRPVKRLPVVMISPARAPESRTGVFVSGPVSDVASVTRILRVAADARCPVTVGRCDPRVEDAIRFEASRCGIAAPAFLGDVSDAAWLNALASAQVLIYLRARGGDNSLAMAGPLHFGLAAGCLCITNDPRAGARELGALDMVRVSDAPERVLADVLAPSHCHDRAALAARVAEYGGIDAVVQVYRSALRR